jgi:hypothetical protein
VQPVVVAAIGGAIPIVEIVDVVAVEIERRQSEGRACNGCTVVDVVNLVVVDRIGGVVRVVRFQTESGIVKVRVVNFEIRPAEPDARGAILIVERSVLDVDIDVVDSQIPDFAIVASSRPDSFTLLL